MYVLYVHINRRKLCTVFFVPFSPLLLLLRVFLCVGLTIWRSVMGMQSKNRFCRCCRRRKHAQFHRYVAVVQHTATAHRCSTCPKCLPDAVCVCGTRFQWICHKICIRFFFQTSMACECARGKFASILERAFAWTISHNGKQRKKNRKKEAVTFNVQPQTHGCMLDTHAKLQNNVSVTRNLPAKRKICQKVKKNTAMNTEQEYNVKNSSNRILFFSYLVEVCRREHRSRYQFGGRWHVIACIDTRLL